MSDDGSLTVSRPASPVSALPATAKPYRFTWDPANRRPGPESVSGTTTDGRGGGDYFSAQPRLALNTADLGHPVLPDQWSSSKHGFHAISTVLNHPHKRQAPPKAHSALPAVVPADLPRVRRKDFDSYLRAVGPEWDRFQQSIELGRDGVAQIGDEERVIALPGPKAVPPLSTVPDVFFQQSFNLADPRTFNAVTDQSTTLDKFSHYADTVEQHLVLEISRRSTSFFAALTNLHDLHAESAHCLSRIAALRTLLTDLDNNSARRGLALIRRQRRAQHLVHLAHAVRAVAGVVDMGRVARSLVAAGQWGPALGVIEEMQRMWDAPAVEQPKATAARLEALTEEQEDDEDAQPPPAKPPAIQISMLRAYAELPEHLRALTMEIAAALSSELVAVLRVDLLERIARTRTVDGKGEVDVGLRDRLRPLIQGLVRTRGVKEGMLSWREVVLAEVRAVVSLRLPVGDTDTQATNGHVQGDETPTSRPGITAHLKGMQHADFMLLLQGIYAGLLNCVEGLQAQSHVIVEIVEVEADAYAKKTARPTATPTQPPISTSSSAAASPSAIRDELADILSSAAELANTQAAKVLSARVDEHAALALPDFLALFNDSWTFVVACEVLCRRMIVGLRGVVVSQAKVFLQAFHQARISRSAKLVEDEQWNPAEVSPALQHITDMLIDSAMRDAPELLIKSEPGSVTTASAPPGGNGSSASAPGAKHLRIEERTYFAVSATAEVLVLLLDYVRLVVNLTMLTTDTMSRVIEFLKAFNSRTCQVVLGAGAMRSAGLKNITAKHLALASQSLSIMFELIPYVRETFRRHLSPKQAVMLVEFDKLKRDYQEHQNEIHSKLIAIMGDRLTAHIKTLQAVDWNVPKPGGGVNDYIEILVKETVTLHKVLSRYLSIPIVEYVMTQVFAAINHGLSEEYGKIELPHQEAKNRLLADAKYLHQKLSALKNVGTPSGMLVTVISEKSIPRTAVPTSPAPPPVPVPTRASTLGATANQRLKGLLSGRSSSASVEKALPPPTRSSTLASPAQPPRPASPAPLPSHANGENGSTSTSPQHQHQPRGTSAGFKQVMEQSGSEPKPSMSLSGAVRPQNEADGSAKGADSGEVEGRSMSPPLPPPPPPVRDLDQATADFSPAHAPCSPPAPESPASLAGSELHSRSRTSMDFEKMGIWTRPDMASVDEAPVRGSDASAAPELGFSAPHAARAQQSVDSVPPPPSVPPTPPDEDGGR